MAAILGDAEERPTLLEIHDALLRIGSRAQDGLAAQDDGRPIHQGDDASTLGSSAKDLIAKDASWPPRPTCEDHGSHDSKNYTGSECRPDGIAPYRLSR
jgi:hypothetical protein